MKANRTSQLVCVDAALVVVVLMGIALLPLAGWVPPISPALDAEGVQAFFNAEANNIRLAGVLLMMGGAFFWPFGAAIANQMKRIEGYHHHPLADTQLATVAGTALAIIIPAACWMVAAFRPERSPELVQLINDLGWMMFIGTVPPAFVQVLVIGFCALTEKEPRRVFPRWFGFFNLWIATGFLVGEAVAFFKTGPFAWDGEAAFWMAATFFFGWILVTWRVVRTAILQQPEATAPGATP